MQFTTKLRNRIDGIEISSESIADEAMRCFEFASYGHVYWRIVFAINLPRASAEYAVLEADLDTGEWLDNLSNGTSIADSFDEFFARAIDFMLKNERGFWYWSKDETSDLFW